MYTSLHLIRAAAAAAAPSLQADIGLTLREVIANIPHDGASVVVYTLVGASVWLLWWGNRNSGKGGPPTAGEDDKGGF